MGDGDPPKRDNVVEGVFGRWNGHPAGEALDSEADRRWAERQIVANMAKAEAAMAAMYPTPLERFFSYRALDLYLVSDRAFAANVNSRLGYLLDRLGDWCDMVDHRLRARRVRRGKWDSAVPRQER